MDLTVNTGSGPVTGFYDGRLMKWFGVPYAMPPVGALRFKRAKECESWEEPKLCDRMPSAPAQMAGGKFEDLTATGTEQSEDCLYLNIWSFEGARNAPVFVYIYGGGHHAGDASAPEYDLSAFARDGIVAVSFNYRLGILGFYDFSGYDAAFESNCGLSDMMAAISWISKNIGAFGGDPDRITVCGESAGGTGVIALMTAPKMKGLFNRAIVMSGIPSNITNDRTQSIQREKYLKVLGLDKGNVKELLSMDVQLLKKGCEAMFTLPDTDTPGIMTPGPVIDDLLPKFPLDAIARGESRDIKCIFGTCRDEGSLFWYMRLCPMSWEEIDTMLRINGYGHKIRTFHGVYGALGEKQAVRAVNRDRMFWADTMRLAMAQSRHNDVTYMYRFDYETPISRVLKLGATHTMDVCPALGTAEGKAALVYSGDIRRRNYKKLTEQLHGAFVDFVRTGRPHVDGEDWDPFNETIQATMHFSRRSHQTIERLNPEIFELWKDIRLYV